MTPDSPLRKWAIETGNRVEGRSLLRFEAVPFVVPTDADWWFFYSPRAVAFATDFMDEWPNTDTWGYKLAVMGPGTDTALRTHPYCLTPNFIGKGSPEDVATAFGKVAAGQRVFFPRARQSRLSVQTMLADQVTVLDAICYDNVAVPATKPIIADVFIFTSPLNVGAYLDHQPLPEDARVLAIGPSTAGALTDRGISCEWPEEPSEAGLLKLL